MLALHGWQDNAGSFDLLAPLLKTHSILAIDIPGHGFSSWLPKGIPYDDIITIHLIRRIKQFFGWRKIKFLGHSAGALVSFIYASLYPEETQFVIALDSLQYKPLDIFEHSKEYAKSIDKFLNLELKNSKIPSYREDEFVKRWMKGTNDSLNEIAVRIMMIRGAKKCDDGTFFFSRDPRVKLNIPSRVVYTREHLEEMSRLIICPYLVLRNSTTLDDEFLPSVIEIMKKNSQEFSIVSMAGTHHLHLTNSSDVAGTIKPFLESYG